MLRPLVSVVTPVFNGEAYLDECISSVLAQTYTNFEYVIVDNSSTDRSLEIAKRYARADPRIRIHCTDRLLPQLENFNLAFSLASPGSAYYKMVEADDWIFPECLEKMVIVGETNPSVGIVTSYQLAGTDVVADGLPFPSTVVSGRQICRIQLLDMVDGHFFVFGSPSAVLIRGDVVRNKVPFFNESAIHGDTDACYSILRTWDLGFVHQVLTFKRVDNAGICADRRHFSPHQLDKFIALVNHGHNFLDRREFDELYRNFRREYFRLLARGLFYPDGWAQYKYHRAGLRTIHYELSLVTLAPHILYTVLSFLMNPAQTTYDLWRAVRRVFRRYVSAGFRGVPRQTA